MKFDGIYYTRDKSLVVMHGSWGHDLKMLYNIHVDSKGVCVADTNKNLMQRFNPQLTEPKIEQVGYIQCDVCFPPKGE